MLYELQHSISGRWNPVCGRILFKVCMVVLHAHVPNPYLRGVHVAWRPIMQWRSSSASMVYMRSSCVSGAIFPLAVLMLLPETPLRASQKQHHIDIAVNHQ